MRRHVKVRRMRALKGDAKRSREDRRRARAGRLARKLKAGALASIVVGALAPTANAEIFAPVDGVAMTSAHAIALAHWGGVEPCSGVIETTWGHLPAEINARSTWIGVQGKPETYWSCSVVFNLDAQNGWDWPKLCTIEEHELGHLSGHDHIADPQDVMSPYYEVPAPECTGPIPTPAAASSVATGSPPMTWRVVKGSTVLHAPARHARHHKRGVRKHPARSIRHN